MAHARRAKPLTQVELARIVLPNSDRGETISGWENDKAVPDATTLGAIAQALGVSADWLLFGSQNGERPAAQVEQQGVSAAPISDAERAVLVRLAADLTAAIANGPPDQMATTPAAPVTPVTGQDAKRESA